MYLEVMELIYLGLKLSTYLYILVRINFVLDRYFYVFKLIEMGS